jgi:hypothetical protein
MSIQYGWQDESGFESPIHPEMTTGAMEHRCNLDG